MSKFSFIRFDRYTKKSHLYKWKNSRWTVHSFLHRPFFFLHECDLFIKLSVSDLLIFHKESPEWGLWDESFHTPIICAGTRLAHEYRKLDETGEWETQLEPDLSPSLSLSPTKWRGYMLGFFFFFLSGNLVGYDNWSSAADNNSADYNSTNKLGGWGDKCFWEVEAICKWRGFFTPSGRHLIEFWFD